MAGSRNFSIMTLMFGVVALSTLLRQVDGAFKADPPHISPKQTNILALHCAPEHSADSRVLAVQIKKVMEEDRRSSTRRRTKRTIGSTLYRATLTSGNAIGIVPDIDRFKGEGKVDQPAYLKIMMAQPDADDAGFYQCDVTSMGANGVEVKKETLTVTTGNVLTLESLQHRVEVLEHQLPAMSTIGQSIQTMVERDSEKNKVLFQDVESLKKENKDLVRSVTDLMKKFESLSERTIALMEEQKLEMIQLKRSHEKLKNKTEHQQQQQQGQPQDQQQQQQQQEQQQQQQQYPPQNQQYQQQRQQPFGGGNIASNPLNQLPFPSNGLPDTSRNQQGQESDAVMPTSGDDADTQNQNGGQINQEGSNLGTYGSNNNNNYNPNYNNNNNNYNPNAFGGNLNPFNGNNNNGYNNNGYNNNFNNRNPYNQYPPIPFNNNNNNGGGYYPGGYRGPQYSNNNNYGYNNPGRGGPMQPNGFGNAYQGNNNNNINNNVPGQQPPHLKTDDLFMINSRMDDLENIRLAAVERQLSELRLKWVEPMTGRLDALELYVNGTLAPKTENMVDLADFDDVQSRVYTMEGRVIPMLVGNITVLQKHMTTLDRSMDIIKGLENVTSDEIAEVLGKAAKESREALKEREKEKSDSSQNSDNKATESESLEEKDAIYSSTTTTEDGSLSPSSTTEIDEEASQTSEKEADVLPRSTETVTSQVTKCYTCGNNKTHETCTRHTTDHEGACHKGRGFCMIDVYQDGRLRYVYKRCATQDDCEAVKKSSANCDKFNFMTLTPIRCHFCCTSDLCNTSLRPSEDIYTPEKDEDDDNDDDDDEEDGKD